MGGHWPVPRELLVRHRAGVAAQVFILIVGVILLFGALEHALWIGIGMVSAGLAVRANLRAERRARALTKRKAKEIWKTRLAEWDAQTHEGIVEKKLSELIRAKEEYEKLEIEEKRALDRLEIVALNLQKAQHLQRHSIAFAAISGIGPVRKNTLAYCGIVTAADIDRQKISRIHGFGPATTGSLLAWRNAVEQNFSFDRAKFLTSPDAQNVTAHRYAREAELRSKLVKGPAELTRTANGLRARRTALRPLLDEAARQYAKAKADVGVLW